MWGPERLLHITLVTFRDDVELATTRKRLAGLALACSDVNVLKPSGAEAERSWHACIEVRGAVEETLASSSWTTLMSAIVDAAEVYKAWTFSPTDA
ncbi:MAG: hypothetical protein ACI9KE_002555 [Polyangiales bacterium]